MLQKSAEDAAHLFLLTRFHEQGKLDDIFNRKGKSKPDECVTDAKTDIYNYAARFDGVPKFQFRTVKRGPRRLLEVTVELAEQNICVTSRGLSLSAAETSAATRFKEAAENYNAERGEGSIIIKDSTALTASNCKQFFDYYRSMYPGAQVTVESELATERKNVGVQAYRAQVQIDGKPVGEPVEMSQKKAAEGLALLTAAVFIKKTEPDLFAGFFGALAAGNGEILRRIPPINMAVDEDCVLIMRDTLIATRRAGLPDEVGELVSSKESVRTDRIRRPFRFTSEQASLRSLQMQKALNAYSQNDRLEELRKKRTELPMNQYSARVLDMVSNNTYSIIVGATGSGKTTQVPQILLEDAIINNRGSECNIICTQPRRIAATSVARRVSEERAETLQDTVGYHVRFDAKLPSTRGSITYCTTGILLQQLQHSPDDLMDSVSHLIIDEVHERDILIDFLLVILKKIMLERAAVGRSTPKVVLMSATIDTDLFASYFKNKNAGGAMQDCPALSVPGRNFPVKEMFLDDIVSEMETTYPSTALQAMKSDPPTKDYFEANEKYYQEQPAESQKAVSIVNQENDSIIDWKQERKISPDGEVISLSDEKNDAIVPHGLVAGTIAHIVKKTSEGALLVFLPGLDDIVKVDQLLREGSFFGVNFQDRSKFKTYMLHSSIPTAQAEVFETVPQECRKIILATNIAETSITIPDVQHVVDTGKLREKRYDQIRRITKLQCTWISKSNSKQRAGRAGRVQNGNYYALFPKIRYESMRAIGLPEMLRSDLQEICLDVKAQAFKTPIREFLAKAIEPPSPRAVDISVRNLQALDALNSEEDLTPLGRLLASLPVHPSLGKMIVLGVLFRCLDPMLILGAAAAERNIFLSPLGARSRAQEAKLSFVQGSGSDHIAILNAVRELRHIRSTSGEYGMRGFAMSNFIHVNAFKSVENTARQVLEILVEAGLIPPSPSQQLTELGPMSLNENSSNTPLIKALSLAGMHPNLGVATNGRLFRTPNENITLVHPSSVNATKPATKSTTQQHEDRVKAGTLYIYSTMARSNDGNSIFLRDTTECTPLMATLFGGKMSYQGPIIEMDDWLRFFVKSMDRQAAKTITEFRKLLERLLSGAFRELWVKKVTDQGERQFIADDKVRRIFAEGLVDVLNRDVRVNDSVASRGWRRGRDSSARSSRNSPSRGNGARNELLDFTKALEFFN